MKIVKCDKCGAEEKIGLVDNDYICEGIKGSYFIKEIAVKGTRYDICESCYKKYQESLQSVDDEFEKALKIKKKD